MKLPPIVEDMDIEKDKDEDEDDFEDAFFAKKFTQLTRGGTQATEMIQNRADERIDERQQEIDALEKDVFEVIDPSLR